MSKLSTCVEDVKNRDGSQKMPLHNYRSELLSNRGTGRQGVQSLAHRKVSYGSNRGRRRVTFNPSSRTRHGAVLEVSRYTARQRNPVGVKLRTLPPWLILQLLVRKVVFLNFRVQRKYDRDVEMRKSSRGVERAASDPFVDAKVCRTYESAPPFDSALQNIHTVLPLGESGMGENEDFSLSRRWVAVGDEADLRGKQCALERLVP